MSSPDERPPLFLVKGTASAEEVAALTVVLQATAAAGAAGSTGRRPASQWSAREHMHRQQLRPGPGAWRASGLPR